MSSAAIWGADFMTKLVAVLPEAKALDSMGLE
jgi:hypothetical protein